MEHGGSAWRGWFPLDGELTSGVPDHKEGIYFGTELGPDDPAGPRRAAAARRQPVPGPAAAAAGGRAELARRDGRVGAALLRRSLPGSGCRRRGSSEHLTADPTSCSASSATRPSQPDGWGVAEHTDYGLLTILARTPTAVCRCTRRSGWIDVPSDPQVFVVNLGDMLERMTAGRYRSTPHRVRNTGAGDRLSFPCFFDPSWDAVCPCCRWTGRRRPTSRNVDGTAPACAGGTARTATTYGQGRPGLPRPLRPPRLASSSANWLICNHFADHDGRGGVRRQPSVTRAWISATGSGRVSEVVDTVPRSPLSPLDADHVACQMTSTVTG